MVKKVPFVVLGLLLSASLAAAQSDEKKLITEATTVMSEMMATGDKGIPKTILEDAVGVAVFPGLIKGGFVVGAQHGRGILSVRDQKTGQWSAPAFLTINCGSFGAQIGAQAIDLILVVKDRRGLQQLVQNQFKIGADAGVAACPIGRDASAATDIQMRAKILSYSRSRGLFAGITLNGSTIHQDRDANERFYGSPLRTGEVVFEHKGGTPDPVSDWIASLNKYSRTTH